MEEAEAPVQEEDEGNEGAFTKDWIEQMTTSVSNIVDRLNDVTDAIVEIQETSLALQNASQRTLQILEADSPTRAQADASQTSPVSRRTEMRIRQSLNLALRLLMPLLRLPVEPPPVMTSDRFIESMETHSTILGYRRFRTINSTLRI